MNIELSTATCQRLKNIMQPDETYELVIRRLLEGNGDGKSEISAPVTSTSAVRPPQTPSSARKALRPKSGTPKFEYSDQERASARHFGKEDYVPLSHTKIFEVFIDGESLEKENWNAIIKHLVRLICGKGPEESQKLTHPKLRTVHGEKDDQGYEYLPDLDISIQGVSADNASRIIVDLAVRWDIPVEIFFGWREKPEAMYPGEFGLIKI